MADNVSIKDATGASVTVLTDEVTHGTFGTGEVQIMKMMDGTPNSTNMNVINASGEMTVVQNSLVSTVNSTAANLAGGAVFTGVAEDISNYAEARVTVFSSHISAVDGLSMQQSSDGTNWDVLDVYTVAAGAAKIVGIGAAAKFFRLVYTNGATTTTSLRIQTVYHKAATRPSSQRPQDARTNDIDLEEVSSFGMLYNGTSWDRQQGVAGAANVRQADMTATGSLTAAAQAVTLSLNGSSATAIQVTGTFSATLQFEGTVDGTTWVPITAIINGGTLGNVTSVTAAGMWIARTGGFASFRVRASAYTSGTAVVTVRAGQGTSTVAIDYALPAGSNTIGTVNVNGNQAVASAVTGNPVRGGGFAVTANPTAVTNGSVSNLISDKLGRLVTVSNHVRDMVGTQGTTITTSTTATTVVTAGGAGVFNDITHIDVSNGSATATVVTLSDGTVNMLFNVPAGGGFVCDYTTPLKATTANTAWTLTCGTSVASIYCNVVYVKNL